MKVGIYLQHYLTHKLIVCLMVEGDNKIKTNGFMTGLSVTDGIDGRDIMMVSLKPMKEAVMVSKIKPILRELNTFNYDCLFDIKNFIGLGNWCDAYDDYFDAWFADAQTVKKLALQCPYPIFQYFLAHHYDVFGLIDAGLAIRMKIYDFK